MVRLWLSFAVLASVAPSALGGRGHKGVIKLRPQVHDTKANDTLVGIKPYEGPLTPEQLRATWPQEWVSRYGEASLLQSQAEANVWSDEVRDGMRHTWRGYKEKAWGHDDVQPESGGHSDWCHMAVTMIDGMSTLWLMGLKDEFNSAASFIERSHMPTQGPHGEQKFFEINIRALGGLLSAYSLSKRPALLETARRLGDNMLGAFDRKGLPENSVDVGTGEASGDSQTNLAEVGTVQMEFRSLSHATGDPKYAKAADAAEEDILRMAGKRGLVPNDIVPGQGFVGDHESMGGCGDSYYEYLLKSYLLSGRKDATLKDHWKASMLEMQDKLVQRTKGGRTFVGDIQYGTKRARMDHLACFVPGMLMLGSRSLPEEEVDPRWEPLANDLTDTCWEMYKRSPSGLAPETTEFDINAEAPNDMSIPSGGAFNMLRPEAAEAIFYRWYYTGDHKYRQMAHSMFQAFEKHSKTKHGYAEVYDVRVANPSKKDKQESFWLAETLKYLYLTLAPRGAIDLDKWVFNTEAQPLPAWN